MRQQKAVLRACGASTGRGAACAWVVVVVVVDMVVTATGHKAETGGKDRSVRYAVNTGQPPKEVCGGEGGRGRVELDCGKHRFDAMGDGWCVFDPVQGFYSQAADTDDAERPGVSRGGRGNDGSMVRERTCMSQVMPRVGVNEGG